MRKQTVKRTWTRADGTVVTRTYSYESKSRKGKVLVDSRGRINYKNVKAFKKEKLNYFKKRKETINGVKVIRTGVIPRGNGGGFMLMLNYLSFLFTAFFKSTILV